MDALEVQKRSATGGFLLLDAGNLLARGPKGSRQSPERANAVFKFYQDMGYDAINVTGNDLSSGIPLIAGESGLQDLPFISSNLISASTGKYLFNPAIVKRSGDLKIGVLGLTDSTEQDRGPKNEFTIQDPSSAVRESISSLEKEVDLVIVLSSLSKDGNVKLLEECSEIDFIISTDRKVHSPIAVNRGFILSAGDKGKYLGRLDLTLESLEDPLHLKDVGRKKLLEADLHGLERRINALKNKEQEVVDSVNPSLKERLLREIERLEVHRAKYSRELASLEVAKDYFVNQPVALIGEASRQAKARRGFLKTGETNIQVGKKVIASASHIILEASPADENRRISVALLVDRTSNEVRAMGMDVTYNPGVLKYTDFERGDLVKGFDMFDARRIREGLVRVGGFEARNDPISAGKGGVLATLYFEVIGEGDQGLAVVRFKDDISRWKAAGSGNTSR